MRKNSKNNLEIPLNVWFDGSFLDNKTGIGRDSRHVLEAINQIPNIRITIVEKRKTLVRRIKGIIKIVFINQPETIEIPPGTILIQSHLHNLIPKGENYSHLIRLHDLFPLTNPEWFRKLSALEFQRVFKKISKDAIFICDSAATQKDLLIQGVEKTRTKVLHCIAQIPATPPCNGCKGCLFDTKTKYILSIGTIEPRKNYLKLLSAWISLPKKSKKNHKLVIVGKAGWKSKKVLRVFRDQAQDSDIVWLEGICDSSLNKVMENSGSVISNTINEGFNLPIAESFAIGKNLVISDIPVHRELYGKLADFYSNHSEKEISKGILTAIEKSSKTFANFNQLNFRNSTGEATELFREIIFGLSNEKTKTLT